MVMHGKKLTTMPHSAYLQFGTAFLCAASPDITAPPANQTIRVSTRVELSCNVSGLPLPQVQWFRVSEEEGVIEVMVDSSIALTELTGEYVVTSTLTLMSIQLQESGTYMCTANNSLGMATAQADITVYCKYL